MADGAGKITARRTAGACVSQRQFARKHLDTRSEIFLRPVESNRVDGYRFGHIDLDAANNVYEINECLEIDLGIVIDWHTEGSVAALLAVFLFGSPSDSPAEGVAPAHDIPGDATVQMFVKPEGDRLRLLARVPLASMQEIEFPVLGPGYLDLAEADEELRDAAMMWIVDQVRLYEDGSPLGRPELLATQVSIPSDRSFASYEEALAHVTGPGLPETTQLVWQQALLDVLIEYSIQSDEAEFTIDPRLERLALRVNTVLRFLPPVGPSVRTSTRPAPSFAKKGQSGERLCAAQRPYNISGWKKGPFRANQPSCGWRTTRMPTTACSFPGANVRVTLEV